MCRAQEARPPQRQCRRGHTGLRKHGIRDRGQLQRRIIGQGTGEFLHEQFQRPVQRRAALQRPHRFVQCIQWPQLQHVFGINRVRIAQPGFDLGHRQPARPRLHRRARRGAWQALALRHRHHLRRQRGEVRYGCDDIFQPAFRRRVQPQHQLLHPLQPARGNGGRTIGLQGAGHQHLRPRCQHGEVVRGQPDAALRLFQPQRSTHGPGEPGIGTGALRPCAFVQPAQHGKIETLQPRFQWTQNEKPWMAPKRSTHRRFHRQAAEQGRIGAGLDGRQIGGRQPQ